MAYKNLVAETGTTSEEFFCNMRDYLCALNGTYNDYSSSGIGGWTIHDSSYAVDADNPATNDWYVIKSTGESGGELLYFQVTFSSTGSTTVKGWLYWNASTHAGVTQYGNSYLTTSGTNHTLWIYGNKDCFSVVVQFGTSVNYQLVCGKIQSLYYDDTVETTSGTISSGSSVVVSVGTVPTTWAVGKKVYVSDEAHIEQATITAISGTDVTLDSLTYSYTSSNRIAQEVGYMNWGSYYCYFLIDHDGATGQYIQPQADATTYYAGGDGMEDKLFIPQLSFINGDEYYGDANSLILHPQSGINDLSNADSVSDGTNNYRYFEFSSSVYLLMKEV